MSRPLFALACAAALGGFAAPQSASAAAQPDLYGPEACTEGSGPIPAHVVLCAQAWETAEDPADVAVALRWWGQAQPMFSVRSLDVQIEYGPGQTIIAGPRAGRLPVGTDPAHCVSESVRMVRFSDGRPVDLDLPLTEAGDCSRVAWTARPVSNSGRRFVMTAQPDRDPGLSSYSALRGGVGTIGRVVRTAGTTPAKSARPYAVARLRVKVCGDVVGTICFEHVVTAVMAPSTPTRLITTVRDGAMWISADTTPYGDMQPDGIWDQAVRNGLVPADPYGATAADRKARAMGDAVTGASGSSVPVGRKGVRPPAWKQDYVWDEGSAEDDDWADAVRDRLVPPDPAGPNPAGQKILPLAEVVGDAGEFGATVVAL